MVEIDCKCGAKLILLNTSAGKKLPVDAETLPRSAFAGYDLTRGAIWQYDIGPQGGARARVANEYDDEVYVPHYATCPLKREAGSGVVPAIRERLEARRKAYAARC